ncbi:hypothetical protein FQA47_016795 [Oryzias melastigma]|uniref:Uncharacterized protein n=1 Tax=Oryzias melastigma TaxID=30732 RepID=A0A834CC66_ORYME|nr:hypothetical protein FQA47_016795 [Oryzias melastigma]
MSTETNSSTYLSLQISFCSRIPSRPDPVISSEARRRSQGTQRISFFSFYLWLPHTGKDLHYGLAAEADGGKKSHAAEDELQNHDTADRRGGRGERDKPGGAPPGLPGNSSLRGQQISRQVEGGVAAALGIKRAQNCVTRLHNRREGKEEETGEEGRKVAKKERRGEGRQSIAALAQWMSSSRGSGGGSISTTRCSISLGGCCGGRDLRTQASGRRASLAFAHSHMWPPETRR